MGQSLWQDSQSIGTNWGAAQEGRGRNRRAPAQYHQAPFFQRYQRGWGRAKGRAFLLSTSVGSCVP